MNRRTFLVTGVALSTGLSVSCRDGKDARKTQGIRMPKKTDQIVADLFAATSAEDERGLAITLSTHLNESSVRWSLSLCEPNSTSRLTPQQFVQSRSAVAVIAAGDACYVWVPQDKMNIDMLMLE